VSFFEDDFKEKEKEDARVLFAGDCDFILGVAELKQLPDTTLPEVAFVGRSNVGKSSLLNALTGRKSLARTSHTPGRTQQLNMFDLGKEAVLVDMPGYGYAKVSKSQKKQWNALVRKYLKGRPNLVCVYVLVDARHGLKESDKAIMEMLDETAVPYNIILTKDDKVKDEELIKKISNAEITLKSHAAGFPYVLSTSAHKNGNIDILKTMIYRKIMN
jgi:GTP-binding protein